jgi:pyruvate/2-oxoglutarate dehydrogenase complex dihydrolipoamide dehydrogenase (E3) component
MNVGCIPSKALLRIAKTRNSFRKFPKMELSEQEPPSVFNPFRKIQSHLDFIREKKTMKMFDKVDLLLGEGAASFVDPHTVAVGERKVTAKRIFICAGTRPSLPDIEGLKDINYLTNENIFSQEKIPESMIVMGGGAIACEMAQAFTRLGCKVTIIIRGPRLMWREDQEATDIFEKALMDDGVKIIREQNPKKFEKTANGLKMHTDKDEIVEAETILIAAGRAMDFEALKLENAGIAWDKRGIKINKRLQTSRSNIYACGDCNGYAQFSHAAMHQGMIALMNAMSPWPVKFNFRNYQIPWTVFTEPQFSRVGMKESELKEKRIKYEVITAKYEDYGAAIAEEVPEGFVKVFTSLTGKIYGATIIGEGSGEMINEWALAIQKKMRLHDIMMLQHSFPTMGFLTKRSSEMWMMKRMKSNFLKKLCRLMFKI